MLFRKKDKPSGDRVLELKARVDSLRQLEGSRSKLLADFLAGDDVVTSRDHAPVMESRAEEQVVSSGRPDGVTDEEILEAELRRYIARYETPGSSEEPQEERQAG